MYRLTLLFAIFSLSFLTCEKEPDVPFCEIANQGILCITNNYDGAVSVSVNNEPFGTISPGSERCELLNVGFAGIEAEEVDFILFQTTWEASRNIVQCEETSVTITG